MGFNSGFKGLTKQNIFYIYENIQCSRIPSLQKVDTHHNFFFKFQYAGYEILLISLIDETYASEIPLKTKRRPLYLKTQSVPRCKHFSSRL